MSFFTSVLPKSIVLSWSLMCACSTVVLIDQMMPEARKTAALETNRPNARNQPHAGWVRVGSFSR
jgi:ABC-type Fe3+ transport system permease subunit